jgi:hypothetical protein
MDELTELYEKLLYIVSVKAHRGCKNKTWYGYENGYGQEFGEELDNVIKQIKKYKHDTKRNGFISKRY